MFAISNIEVLLAQQTIIDNMTRAERRELVAEALIKDESKEQYGYGFYSEQMTAWVIGRVLQSEDYQPFMQQLAIDKTLQTFLTLGSFHGENVSQGIFLLARQYLAEE